MKRNLEKRILILLFMLATLGLLSVKVEAANIKNNVSVSADTGGNSGAAVSTGSASAESSVKNQVSGSTDSGVSTDVKVEVNGVKKEMQVSEPGNISIQMQDKNGKVETNIETIDSHVKASEAFTENFWVRTRQFFHSAVDWFKNIF